MSRPRQVSDEQILSVAREVFLEHGAAVSTTVIAGQLGISQPALFKRFGTKQRLLLAALRPSFPPPWVGIVNQGPDARPMREQLLELATAMTSFFERVVPGISVLVGCGMSPRELFADLPHPPPVLAHQALTRWFGQAMEAGQLRSTDPASVAMSFIGSLHARVFIGQFAQRQLVSDDYVLELVDQFCRALSPEESS